MTIGDDVEEISEISEIIEHLKARHDNVINIDGVRFHIGYCLRPNTGSMLDLVPVLAPRDEYFITIEFTGCCLTFERLYNTAMIARRVNDTIKRDIGVELGIDLIGLYSQTETIFAESFHRSG